MPIALNGTITMFCTGTSVLIIIDSLELEGITAKTFGTFCIMCTSPKIILIKNVNKWQDSKTIKRRIYRKGMPTDKFYTQYIPSYIDSNRQNIIDSAIKIIDNRSNQYPFLTQQIEAEIEANKSTVHWNDTKSIIKNYLYVPIKLKNGYYRNYQLMLVPCGHCEECIKKYTREVSWLIDKDMRYTPQLKAFYITLTYDPQHLPTDTDKCQLGHESDSMFAHCSTGFLHRKDLQDWLKRIRITLLRWYGIKDVKVAYCGEYGKKTCRPHYHVLLWFSDNNASQFGYQYKGKKENLLKYGFKSGFADYIIYGNKVPPLNESFFRSLSFDLWGKCRSNAFNVQTPRCEYALARYFTKYLLKSRSGLLPDEISEDFAPRAVPMFFRMSCHIAHNWANHNFDSDLVKMGFESFTCSGPSGSYTYNVKIPSLIMAYVDELRKENDLPALNIDRKIKAIEYLKTKLKRDTNEYKEFMYNCHLYDESFSDDDIVSDPNLFLHFIDNKPKFDVSIKCQIQKTIFNDETYL